MLFCSNLFHNYLWPCAISRLECWASDPIPGPPQPCTSLWRISLITAQVLPGIWAARNSHFLKVHHPTLQSLIYGSGLHLVLIQQKPALSRGKVRRWTSEDLSQQAPRLAAQHPGDRVRHWSLVFSVCLVEEKAVFRALRARGPVRGSGLLGILINSLVGLIWIIKLSPGRGALGAGVGNRLLL